LLNFKNNNFRNNYSKFPKIDIFTFLYFLYLIISKKVSSISTPSIFSFRYANSSYGYLLFSYYPEKNLLVGQDRGTLVMDDLLRHQEEGNPFENHHSIQLIPVISDYFLRLRFLRCYHYHNNYPSS
jgi:hypothetical protein